MTWVKNVKSWNVLLKYNSIILTGILILKRSVYKVCNKIFFESLMLEYSNMSNVVSWVVKFHVRY